MNSIVLDPLGGVRAAPKQFCVRCVVPMERREGKTNTGNARLEISGESQSYLHRTSRSSRLYH